MCNVQCNPDMHLGDVLSSSFKVKGCTNKWSCYGKMFPLRPLPIFLLPAISREINRPRLYLVMKHYPFYRSAIGTILHYVSVLSMLQASYLSSDGVHLNRWDNMPNCCDKIQVEVIFTWNSKAYSMLKRHNIEASFHCSPFFLFLMDVRCKYAF